MEESAKSFNKGLPLQHTPLTIFGSVKILLEVPVKDKASHGQKWLVFILCAVLCLLRLKQHISWEAGYLYR